VAVKNESSIDNLDYYVEQMKSLQNLQKQARSGVLRAWAIALPAMALAGYASNKVFPGVFGWILTAAAVTAILFWVLQRQHAAQQPYRNAYREKVLQPLIEQILPGFKHEPEEGIARDVYMASRLFPTSPDRYSSEDRFEGEVDGVPLTFAEVHAEEEQEDCDDDGCHTSYSTIFKGLFALVEFPKKFKGTILLYPDRSEKLLGALSRSLQNLGGRFRGLQLVKLEDPVFERYFVVFGDDPLVARYVLSTSMMERLRQFRERYGEVYASFLDGALYLAMPQKRNLFEQPSLFHNAVDVRGLELYADALKMMRDVVRELQLNVRIWGERALGEDAAKDNG